jgi:hypothetical protein
MNAGRKIRRFSKPSRTDGRETRVRGQFTLLTGLAATAVLALTASAAWSQDLIAAPTTPAAQPVIVWDQGVLPPDVLSASFTANNTVQTSLIGAVDGSAPNGLIGLRTSTAWAQTGGGAIDQLRVTSGAPILPGSGAPVWINPGGLSDQLFDVTYTRGWPSALSLQTGRYAMDVTPHAGLGLTSAGESAEAGATVRFGGAGAFDKLKNGVGQPGHWYFYAQTSGRAVGYNFLHTDDGWRRAGLFSVQDPSYVGDAEAGVAWRKGDVQASFGYVQRDIRLQNMRDFDADTHESIVAFTLSFRPGQR